MVGCFARRALSFIAELQIHLLRYSQRTVPARHKLASDFSVQLTFWLRVGLRQYLQFHAIDRTVAGQPYLKFVYTHLDYPFDQRQDAPVQLHAIGISLVNVLCSELDITAHKQDVTLRMSFKNGRLADYERVDAKPEKTTDIHTGNTISGKVNPQLQKDGVNVLSLRQWLIALMTASPTLRLSFNGVELQVLAQPDAQPES